MGGACGGASESPPPVADLGGSAARSIAEIEPLGPGPDPVSPGRDPASPAREGAASKSTRARGKLSEVSVMSPPEARFSALIRSRIDA